LTEVVVEEPEVDIVEKIKKARSKDKEVVKVVRKMKKAEVKVLRDDKWQTDEELILKKSIIYILKNKELRIEIIWLYYNMLIAKHCGRWKITDLVTRNYW